jgi:glycogen(starch) synthase
MRVLILSWEYPPVLVGGLGQHVRALARQLSAQGHDVVVLCRHQAGTDAITQPTEDVVADGVRVIRVAEDPPHLEFERDLVAWTLAMGHAMMRGALSLLGSWRPDVIHAHDWLVAHPAIALAEHTGVPLVATIHATEAGRQSGWLAEPLNRQVHSVEWWLANRADALITCSAAMRTEVTHLFDVPEQCINVIHNGIDTSEWKVPGRRVRALRRQRRQGPMVLYFGRLEWEKGVHDLITALPWIRMTHPEAYLVVAGKGGNGTRLRDQVREMGIVDGVDFVGHLDEWGLAETIAIADVVVIPSRYEPFGIVALEAVAIGAPLVTSTAGGLAEVVINGETGLSFMPGDVVGLAAAVRAVFDEPAAARRRAAAAKARLPVDFDWAGIAARTAEVYRSTEVRDHPPLGRPKIATGNAFR